MNKSDVEYSILILNLDIVTLKETMQKETWPSVHLALKHL